MIFRDHMLLFEKLVLPSEILIIPTNLCLNLKNFLEKNFPDKFCPVSGFVPNCPDSWIFFNPWFRHAQNEYLWWSPMSPMSLRFLRPKSGFLKTSFLKPTVHENFFGKKIFPDKIGPGSGFVPKLSFLAIFLNSSYISIQDNQKLRFSCC